MVKLAIEDNPTFELSTIELNRPGPHYTADTLKLLAEQNPDAEIVPIIGGDSLRDLPKWHEPQQLVYACHWIGVMRRPNEESNLDELERELPGIRSKVHYVDAPLMEIASREIRNRIAEGKFDQPVVDHGEDELGELAAAFDRMRVQLAQLDTARKEFVANASHELRTPLFSLGGFLELMSDEDLDEETRAGFLATTREQVERLTRLSADLLDLSRMDAGRLHVESDPGAGTLLSPERTSVAGTESLVPERYMRRPCVDSFPRNSSSRFSRCWSPSFLSTPSMSR